HAELTVLDSLVWAADELLPRLDVRRRVASAVGATRPQGPAHAPRGREKVKQARLIVSGGAGMLLREGP
ncbi:hypothetical protein ACWEPZ_16210, partial [Streptomyces sp. NPDC004288]